MIRSIWCFIIYGHIWDKTGCSSQASRTMNTCKKCGKVVAGPD